MLENVLHVMEYIASPWDDLHSSVCLLYAKIFILALMSVHKYIKQRSVNICVKEYMSKYAV